MGNNNKHSHATEQGGIEKHNRSRRKVLLSLGAGGAIGHAWVSPVVETVVLPAHAQTTTEEESRSLPGRRPDCAYFSGTDFSYSYNVFMSESRDEIFDLDAEVRDFVSTINDFSGNLSDFQVSFYLSDTAMLPVSDGSDLATFFDFNLNGILSGYEANVMFDSSADRGTLAINGADLSLPPSEAGGVTISWHGDDCDSTYSFGFSVTDTPS